MALATPGSVGLIFQIVGIMLLGVGFWRPNWVDVENSKIHMGLWQSCIGPVCSKASTTHSFQEAGGLPGWFRATQVLACLAVVTVSIDFILILLYICGFPKQCLLFSVLSATFAAFFALVGATLFGSKIQSFLVLSVGWAYVLFLLGGIGILVHAVFFIVEYTRN